MATLPDMRREVDEFFRRVFEEAAEGDPDFIRKRQRSSNQPKLPRFRAGLSRMDE